MADLDGLRGGRDVEAKGRLTMDRARAREKMRLFRLPDPHFYVLQFVRAASVLGSPSVRFEFNAGWMSCEFDRVLPVERFDDFWAVAFEERRTPADHAMHNIALGIGSAQALNPGKIRIKSGRRSITFEGDEETLADVTDSGRTHISIFEKFRFGHLADFFTEHAEAAALRSYCGHATMEVSVDGRRIAGSEGYYKLAFEARDEVGWVALIDSGQTLMHFLRDDVLVKVVPVRRHVRAAIGVLNSRTLQTDLSGLALLPGAEVDRLLHDRLIGTYHATLLSWIERTNEAPPLALGLALSAYLKALAELGFTPAPKTRELQAWFLRQRAFTPASWSGALKISIDQTSVDGVIPYAKRSFPDARLDAYPQVILAENEEVRRLLETMRDAGISTLDVTQMLEDSEALRRNRTLWEARVPLDPPNWPIQIKVGHDGVDGYLFFPLQKAHPTRRDIPAENRFLDHPHVAFSVRIHGRMVRRVPLDLPLGIVIDGELMPNERFSDVARVPQFLNICVALVNALPDFLAMAAARTSETHDRVHVNDLLFRAVSGTLPIELLRHFGYTAELRRPLKEHLPNPETPRSEILEWLGPVAELPWFAGHGGRSWSLLEIAALPRPPIIIPSAVAASASLHPEDLVLYSNDGAEHVLTRLRPDSRSGRDAITSLYARARFEAREPYELSPIASLAERTRTVAVGAGSAEIRAQLLGPGRFCDVYLFHHDRLLGRRDWTAFGTETSEHPGRFRIVVRSASFSPTADYLDVVDDEFVTHVHAAAIAMSQDVARSWAAESRLVTQTTFTLQLLWDVTLGEFADGGSPALPVFMRDSNGWSPGFAPYEEIVEAVRAAGDLLAITRSAEPPETMIDESTVILRLSGRRFSLKPLFPGVRIMDLDTALGADEARVRFFKTLPVERHVAGAAHTWRGQLLGCQVQIGLLTGIHKPSNHVSVVLHGRRLEDIRLSVPFGRFETRVSSRHISPDPTYEFAASHRAELLQAADRAVVEVVCDACARLSRHPEGPLGELEPLRAELLAMLAECHRAEAPVGPEVYDALCRTPLFDVSTGVRVAHVQLADLAVEGTLSFTERASAQPALVVLAADAPRIESAIGPAFALLPLAQVRFLMAKGPRYHNDEVLNLIAAMLIDARGDRVDLFDDAVAYGFAWDDKLEGLCVASAEGVRIRQSHPLVIAAAASMDPRIVRFVASAIYSEVNRYYRSITDHDELELQARLLTI